ncbi:hypothetical protein FQR65_LT03335 [Abscondita terminalis]|nr:hypothetical protein FQR65_LT03335 [Abscondita terminalis]
MLLLILIVLFALIIAYFKQKNNYWYLKGVECPPPKIIFGNMYDIVTNKITRGRYYHQLYKKFKSKNVKCFGIYAFVTPILFVIDPHVIKSILQTDFEYFHDRVHYVNEYNEPTNGHLFKLKGGKWKQLRTKLTPTFTSSKMKMMFNTLFDCSRGLIKVLDQSIKNNELVDIHNVVLRYTTDVIVSCAFGVDCDALVNPNSHFIKYANLIIEPEEFKEFFSLSFPKIDDLVGINIIPEKVKKFLNELVTQIINSREINKVERRDFMDLLIKLKNNKTQTEMSLTFDEIVAQVYLFFLAGFETSSTALTFCLYELAVNEDVQEKLRNEVHTILKENGGELTYDALSKMTYMDMIIKESLRKYPPLVSINRKCVKTYKVPDSNLVIDKGTNIFIPVLSIHSDENYYPNPKKFHPERFASKTSDCIWLAFGEGPRNCIGLRFGLMQVKTALASIITNYQFTTNRESSIVLKSIGPFLAPEITILIHVTKFPCKQFKNIFGRCYTTKQLNTEFNSDAMLLLIVILLFALIIAYFKRKNNYWNSKGVECPPPIIIFGNMYDIVTNKITRGKYYSQLYKKFKSKNLKCFGIYAFVTPILFVIDPHVIKSILQTDFEYFHDRVHYVNEFNEPTNGHLFRLKGEKWKQLRTKLTPTFTSSKVKMMFNTLLDCSMRMNKVIDESVKNNESVNIHNVVLRYTTNVIVSCAFGIDCDALINPNSYFIKYANLIIEPKEFKEFFSLSFPKIADLVKIHIIPTKVKSFFNDLVTQIINNREINNIERRDFMDLLIKLKNNQTQSDMSLTFDEIVAQVYLFFLAGFETSSTALTFCLYELAVNEDIQEKLRNEVHNILNENGGELTYEAMSKTTYMDMIIKESLRKYPPVVSINRKCVKTYKVPDSNLVIDKGTNIFIPVLSIHSDEDYYPNPTKFDPERFASKASDCIWLAFGEGPRNCIGLRFGLMQVKVALASIIANYRFTTNSEFSIILKSIGPFLAPENEILLHMSKC